MAVYKYKPKLTPRILERALEQTASGVEKTIDASKKAITRSRQLLEDARHSVDEIRKRKGA